MSLRVWVIVGVLFFMLANSEPSTEEQEPLLQAEKALEQSSNENSQKKEQMDQFSPSQEKIEYQKQKKGGEEVYNGQTVETVPETTSKENQPISKQSIVGPHETISEDPLETKQPTEDQFSSGQNFNKESNNEVKAEDSEHTSEPTENLISKQNEQNNIQAEDLTEERINPEQKQQPKEKKQGSEEKQNLRSDDEKGEVKAEEPVNLEAELNFSELRDKYIFSHIFIFGTFGNIIIWLLCCFFCDRCCILLVHIWILAAAFDYSPILGILWLFCCLATRNQVDEAGEQLSFRGVRRNRQYQGL